MGLPTKYTPRKRMTLSPPVVNYLRIHHRDLVCGETPARKPLLSTGSKWQLARISGAARYATIANVYATYTFQIATSTHGGPRLSTVEKFSTSSYQKFAKAKSRE
ncbi:hypothetical protein ALC57_07687 [Trachymyrmex cornetzi]|uniref:Uncharacterized protein n=1 Tax=Trachymyrmex cornetzi TaxID=471704 RepID=A0A195E438_9HYME|nr:hypothetical protein ALC57_07687 [Trachymyrmex cornetzi]